MERYDIDELGCMSPRADGDYVLYADAQRALDAEREKVAKLEKIQAIDLKNNNEYRRQLATLQAQLRQVEGERVKDVSECVSLTNQLEQANKGLSTLRQLVEAIANVRYTSLMVC